MNTKGRSGSMIIRTSFRQALPYFPAAVQMPLSRLPEDTAEQVQEIRLRRGKTVHLVTGGKESVLTPAGTLSPREENGIRVTNDLMDTVFQNLCAHSVHAVQHMLIQGYVITAGGSRAGICGTAVMQNGAVAGVRNISGINLRIASERIGCGAEIAAKTGLLTMRGGLLLCGPPSSGKTTVLRDFCRILGDVHRVSVIDERGEIAAVQGGIPQFSLGACTDVFDGMPKAEGIAAATRVMSPEILVCDELGGEAETAALLASMHSGVRLIATAHAESIRGLYARPQIRRLIEAGVFDTAVLLGTGEKTGQAAAIAQLTGGTR